MPGRLITLPFRIWLRSIQLTLRVGEELTGRAAEAAMEMAGAVIGARRGGGPPSPQEERPEPPPPRRPPEARRAEPERPAPRPLGTEQIRRPPRRRRTEDIRPASPPRPPEEIRPAHISEEPELVLESAEPGAENGAGASVTVLAPWEGYQRMGARQVIDRLAGATTEELAAVQLYEGSHRNRRTVLEAVQRQLRSAAGNASGE